MKTAVEWYAEQAMRLELERAKGIISINQMLNQLSNVLDQAKEMEKEQIQDAFTDGDYNYFYSKKTGKDFKNGIEYYNEKFKKDEQ
jgi:hypothetical protein